MTRATDAAIARAYERALLSFDVATPWSVVYRRMEEWVKESAADEIIRSCDPSASSHGFDRTASHSNGTYVCECGGNGEMPADFDAESPAGTVDEICDCGYVRGSFGCDGAHKIASKVTTSPEPVYFSAQPTHVRCPKCTASIPVGKTCAGPHCGLKE